MYILGALVYFVSLYLALDFKHLPLSIFYNPPVIILYLMAILSVLVATRSFGIFVSGFKAMLIPGSDVPEEVRGRAASLFRTLSKTCAFAMIMGMFIGFMAALFGLYNSIDSLGAALSATMVYPLFGLLLIAVVFEPAVFILKKRPEMRGERRK